MKRMIELPFKVKKPILACGADMKGSFAFASGNEAFIVENFGDLGNLDNLVKYERAVKRYGRRLGVRPKIIACDLHPGYFSTRFAEDYAPSFRDCVLFRAQHHEAHIAATITDDFIVGDVIGVAFDGTGFGWDKNMWGGEFFVGSPKKMKRVAHFRYVQMLGGEMAVREPWRMAISYLYQTFGKSFLDLGIDFIKTIDRKDWPAIKAVIDRRLKLPFTSSVGRLFDAAGSLILCRKSVRREAELPIMLERIASIACRASYDFEVVYKDGEFIIDASPIIRSVVKDLAEKKAIETVSAKFHNAIADVVVEVTAKLNRKFGLKKVVLSGGVFQNKFLSRNIVTMLERKKFKVYTSLDIPVNDSGIPVGQIAIANARVSCV